MRTILLTQGKVAIVDDEDYGRLSMHKWHVQYIPANGTYYAMRGVRDGERHKSLGMHREILDAPEGTCVDHINHDPLDNRRANLRFCTHAGNMRNRVKHCQSSSRFKGVWLNKPRAKWRAGLKVNGQSVMVGTYGDEIEAAQAYDEAALHYFGEFASLNFPGIYR